MKPRTFGTRSVSTTELRRSLADVLSRAHYAGERTVVERGGKPVAAVVPLGDLLELLDLDAADRVVVEEAFAEGGEPVPMDEVHAGA